MRRRRNYLKLKRAARRLLHELNRPEPNPYMQTQDGYPYRRPSRLDVEREQLRRMLLRTARGMVRDYKRRQDVRGVDILTIDILLRAFDALPDDEARMLSDAEAHDEAAKIINRLDRATRGRGGKEE